MRKWLLGALAVVGMTATSGCQAGGDDLGTPSLGTNDQKASYAIGLNMGRTLEPVSGRIDMLALRAGIRDAMANADPQIAPEELQTVMEQFSTEVNAEQEAERAEAATKNEEEGSAYLAENGAREGVVTTDSGLQYEVMREGSGAQPAPGDQVKIHYKGTLIDGTEFDSSYGGEPAQFAVGGVIPGFSEGLQLMAEGSQYRMVIPGDLGYGPMGSGGAIGPNATLIFEVEMIEVVPAPTATPTP